MVGLDEYISATTFAGQAQATPVADTFELGSSFNSINLLNNGVAQTFNGGIYEGTLNGLALNQLYCVNIFSTIDAASEYTQTSVSFSGVVNNSTVQNAGAIAYIINNLAPQASTTAQQEAIQVAIWNQETNGLITAASNQDYTSAYNDDIAALGSHTAAISSVQWITPNGETTFLGPISTDNGYQGLVSAVPEPEEWAMMMLGIPFMSWVVRRKQAQLNIAA